MKKDVYLARVIKTNDGWYAIDFPDLPGAHAQCKDLKDVQREAKKALSDFLLTAKEVGEEVFTPSSMITLDDGEIVTIVTADREDESWQS